MKLIYNPVFLIIILLLILVLYNSFKTDLIKVQSINNKYYYTQKVKSLEASKILIILEEFAKKLSHYVIKENPENLYIKNKLKKNIIIKEIPSKYSKFVSYIQNKHVIYICLRKDKYTFENNINELYYILMHEIAHLITKKYGHDTEYWDNYKLLLNTAIKNNLYMYKNYSKNPINICNSKIINSTPI
tara:strand:+ start:2309 stop:2872 length:564 start_codon:yes stop_codon:yes gene_type:complete